MHAAKSPQKSVEDSTLFAKNGDTGKGRPTVDRAHRTEQSIEQNLFSRV